jgi:hypothetical protein
MVRVSSVDLAALADTVERWRKSVSLTLGRDRQDRARLDALEAEMENLRLELLRRAP